MPALLASLVVGLAAGVTVQSRRRLIVPMGVLTLVGVGGVGRADPGLSRRVR